MTRRRGSAAVSRPDRQPTPAGRPRTGGLPRTWHGHSFDGVVFASLFVAAVVYSLVHAGIGWSNTLLGLHGFRQTQTAFSTYAMLRGGPWLEYETPVLGAPWAVPFEFPLYQWAVALVVKAFGMPLDQGGRLVSELFFYATLVPAYALLAGFRVRPMHRLIFLVLLLLSPEYLYWSRAFMIESAALFCAMSYLAFAVCSLSRRRLGDMGGAALFGALAAMVKFTTFFVFLLAAGLYIFCAWWHAGSTRFSRKTAARFVLPCLLVIFLPVACGLLWTGFADAVRAQNPLAGFVASAALTPWYFGTTAQRLSRQPWLILWSRTLPDVIGHGMLLIPVAALLIASRRRLVLAIVCVALFLSAPLTFTNLHLIHNYYAYANGLFLTAAIGWCIVGCLERAGPWRWLAAVVLVGVIGASVWRYQQVYVPWQRTNVERLLETARVVESATKPDDVVLALGLDWSSELPYYARRRSVMNRDGRLPEDPIMRRALDNLRDHSVGAMVVCFGALRQRPLIERWLRAVGLSPTPRRTADCEVYPRPA